MSRSLHFAAVLTVGLFPVWSNQTAKEPPKPEAKVPTPKVPANINARGRAVGGGTPKGAKAVPFPTKLPNPQIQRFLRMTPEEREIIIDKMPIPRQEQFRQAAVRWDKLTQEERDRRLKLFDALSSLPKDQQDLIDQRLTEFNQLPQDRKIMIRGAYQRISQLPEAERQTWMDRPEFKERFTPIEQQIIKDLVTNYPNPQIK